MFIFKSLYYIIKKPKLTTMLLTKIPKIVLSIIFLILCGLMAYFQVIHTTLDYLLASGFDNDTIYLTLTIPIITFLVSFARIIIGISINTIYIPIIIILTSLAIGLNITLIILVLCLVLAILAKYFINEFHFHFGSKISIIISIVTIGLIFALPLISSINKTISPQLLVYGALITSVINEKFFNYKINKNTITGDLKQILKTLLFCIFSYFLLGGTSQIGDLTINFSAFKNLILAFPEIILISLLINIFIGQYTGLRLDEVIRFRKLIFKNK